jgi:hypothetical protein
MFYVAGENMSIFEDKYIQNKLKEFDLKAEYNENTRNYDIISTYPDYKGREYVVLSCEEDGFFIDNHIDFNDESEPFYTYVVNLQGLKADEKYKDNAVTFDGFNTVIDLKSENEDIKRKMVIKQSYTGDTVNFEVYGVETYGTVDFENLPDWDMDDYARSANGELGEYDLYNAYDNKDAMYCVFALDMGEDKHNFRNVANYIDTFNNDINEISDMQFFIDMYDKYEVKEVITEEEFVAVMNEINKIEQEEGLER